MGTLVNNGGAMLRDAFVWPIRICVTNRSYRPERHFWGQLESDTLHDLHRKRTQQTQELLTTYPHHLLRFRVWVLSLHLTLLGATSRTVYNEGLSIAPPSALSALCGMPHPISLLSRCVAECEQVRQQQRTRAITSRFK